MTTQHTPADARTDVLAELFTYDQRGLDITGNHSVIPGAIARAMGESWCRRYAALVHEARCAHPELPWPAYQVTPMTRAPLGQLSPDKLAEVGVDLEVDEDARCRLYDRRTRAELSPETVVWVSCPDPLLSMAGHQG